MSWGSLLGARERSFVAGCAMRIVRADGVVNRFETRAVEAVVRHVGVPARDLIDGICEHTLAATERALEREHPGSWGRVVRRLAYAGAEWASLADGVVNDAEISVLQELRERLGLSIPVAARIAERARDCEAHVRERALALGGDVWMVEVDVLFSSVLADLVADGRCHPLRSRMRA